ncbi:MAG TPA: ammonium transporter [Actinobacteria bacterium]|nr:ammonium transporter [Actinomycetes bacterium]HEX21777.1 ammonium transporter [Actinomycetota bacterium]
MVRRFRWSFRVISLTLLILVIAGVAVAYAGDPGGTATGGKDSYNAIFGGQSVKEAVGHLTVALNFVWVFLAAELVFFMQAGFAMVETGFTRAKNASHVMMTNLTIFAIGALAYWAIGFGLMFGGASGIASLGGTAPLNGLFEIVKGWGIFGTKGFFLVGGTYDVGVFMLFLFQMVFMDTAATIPTGGLAERWKFSAFCIYGVFIAGLLYPIYGNWVWGGGWLASMGTNLGLGHGYIDWAGSSVIHAVGGITALAGAMVLGPRIGKFNKDGSANAMPGHHIPMAIVGTIILAFGWFGFNAGSTLAATDLRISVIAVNTMLAGAAGSIAAMLYVWKRFGKPDPSMTANGLLAGLVAITAPCAFVGPVSAVIIGSIAGVLVVFSVLFVERVLKVDDPVGAISVHGVCGIWGVIALGIFADGTYGAGYNGINTTVRGLLFGGSSQFFAQLIGAVTVIIYTFALAYGFFKLLDAIMGIRSSRADEIAGLDLPEMGMLAYPSFAVSSLDSVNGQEAVSAETDINTNEDR